MESLVSCQGKIFEKGKEWTGMAQISLKELIKKIKHEDQSQEQFKKIGKLPNTHLA